MPTSRFCELIGMPERTWRRHQARARADRATKGPWPRPVRARVRDAARRHALAHPAWGHRKVWAMVRYDGHAVSQATILRLLRDEDLILEANYQRERRQLAARRKAAFATAPTGPIPASGSWTTPEFETTSGGTWRIAGCRDYWSKYAHRFHISPTANQHDAIAAVELALAEAAELGGRPLRDLAQVDDQGNIKPVVTIVTDNGGPFRSFRFEAFIATHPELRHVRTRVRTPGQNGSRERGFGTLKYERLYIDEIDDAVMLAKHAENYRIEYNTIRPHEALAWNRPHDVHQGLASPTVPTFQTT